MTDSASTAPVLYTLSDKTAMVTPNGNSPSPSGGWAAYETTYRTDDLATTAPNVVPTGASTTGGVCSANGAATGNTGVLCETDAPASAGNSVPKGYCQASQSAALANFGCTLMTYDNYGQKVTMASPLAVVTASSSSTIPVTAYVYGQDSDRDLTGTVTAGGWLKAVADPTAGATNGSPSATALTGHFVAYGYDTAGNIARTWDRNATTLAPGTEAAPQAPAMPAVSTYPGTVAAPPSYNSTTLPFTQMLHAALGNSTASLTSPWRYVRSSTDQLGDVTNTCVNANGDSTVIRPPRGSNGTLMADSDCATAAAAVGAPAGTYDTRSTYDASDEPLTTVAPLGATGSTPPGTNVCLSPGTSGAVRYACTSSAYDAYGNTVLTVSPNSSATTAPYDHAVATAYDAVNRPVATLADRDSSGTGTQATTGCPLVSSYTTAPASTLTGYFASTDTACSTGTTYDGLGNTISSTDGTGATTWNEYDAVSRKTSSWAPRFDSVFTGTLRTDTVYDQDNNVVATCPPREFDTGSSAPSTGEPVASGHTGESSATGGCSTAPGPFSTGTMFDPADHAITVTRHRGTGLALIINSGYDADGNQVSTTDPNGNTSHYVFDNLDRKQSMSVPRSGTVSETTAYGYDPAGDTLYTDAPGNGTAHRRTLTTYDADNRAVDTITGADNDTVAAIGSSSAANQVNLRSRNFYDADGHVIATLDPRSMDPGTAQLPHTVNGSAAGPTNADTSYLTYTDYDANGRSTASYSPRTTGTSGVAPDPGIDTVQAGQCTTGKRPASVISAPNTTAPAYPSSVTVCVTRTTYDATGNQASTVMPTSTGSDNRYTATTYTNDNLEAAVSSPAPAGQPNGTRVSTSSIYDGAGRVTTATDALGRKTLTQYNQDGTQAAQTLPANASGTDVTTNGYDANGEQTSTTNAMNQKSTTTFNSDGTTSDSIDAQGDDTHYTYDNNGNAVQILHPDGTYSQANPMNKNPANPNADPVVQSYTADNLLASTATATTPGTTTTSTVNSVWRRNDYTYDDAGRSSTTHTYESNSPTSATPLSGADAGTQTVSYYPTDLTQEQDGRNGASSENIKSTYDAAGNVMATADSTNGGSTISDTYYLDSLLASTVDGMRVQNFSYDGAGTESARSDGPMSQTPTVTSYALADDDSVGAAMDPAVSSTAVSMSYDNDGEMTGRTNPDGTTQSDTYNTDGTLQGQALKQGSTTVASQSYGYDALKRVASQGEGGVSPDQSTYCYSYDTAGRLNGFMTTSSSCGTVPNNITYDPDGNRTAYNGVTTANNPDDSIAALGSATYSYNAAGDVTNDGTNQYSYDGFDRLGTAMTAGATSCTAAATCTNYAYDGLDRQRSHTSTTASGRAPANTAVVQSFDGTSTSVADESIQSPGVTATSYDLTPTDTPLAAVDGTPSQMSMLTDDGRGSIATAMSSTGACAVRYDPFGNPMTAAGGNACQNSSPSTTTIDDLDYNDGKRDANTGQYQLGSRTYSPTSAAYLTPDTYRAGTSSQNAEVGTDPLTADAYTYVNGDPINEDDPDGHRAVCPDGSDAPQPSECPHGSSTAGSGISTQPLPALPGTFYKCSASSLNASADLGYATLRTSTRNCVGLSGNEKVDAGTLYVTPGQAASGKVVIDNLQLSFSQGTLTPGINVSNPIDVANHHGKFSFSASKATTNGLVTSFSTSLSAYLNLVGTRDSVADTVRTNWELIKRPESRFYRYLKDVGKVLVAGIVGAAAVTLFIASLPVLALQPAASS